MEKKLDELKAKTQIFKQSLTNINNVGFNLADNQIILISMVKSCQEALSNIERNFHNPQEIKRITQKALDTLLVLEDHLI